MAKHSTDTTIVARIDDFLARAQATEANSPPDALPLFSEALALAEAVEDLQRQAIILHLRGMCNGKAGQIDLAYDDFHRGLALSRACGDRSREARCLHGLSAVHIRRGDYGTALEPLLEAMVIQRAENQRDNLVYTLCNLATAYGCLGDYHEAARHLFEALEICNETGLVEPRVYCLNNLGLVKKECRAFDDALALFDEAIEAGASSGDKASICNTLCSKANVLWELGRLPEAEATALAALEIAQESKIPMWEVGPTQSLGLIYTGLRQLDKAESYLHHALQLAEQGGLGMYKSGIYHATSICYELKDNLPEARRYLSRAVKEAEQRNEKKFLADILLKMVELYERDGEYATALQYHRAYHDQYEALQLEAAHRLLVAQKARLEVRKAEEAAVAKQREIDALTMQIAQKAVELRAAEARAMLLVRQATTDPLTGLYNRRYLYEYLPEALSNAQSQHSPVTIVIADLDNFKQINDQLSHRTGDEVLKTTARLFHETCRPCDTVVRQGGEEFVVVLPNANVEEAYRICEGMRHAIENYDWRQIHPALTVTTSIGGVTAVGTDYETLLAQADEHLYEAKRNGKNQTILREQTAPSEEQIVGHAKVA